MPSPRSPNTKPLIGPANFFAAMKSCEASGRGGETQTLHGNSAAPMRLRLAVLVKDTSAALDIVPSEATRRRARHIRDSRGRRRRRKHRAPTWLSEKNHPVLCGDGAPHSAPPAVPSFPTHACLKDAGWKSLGCWAIDTLNPNSWTTAETILPKSSADFVAIQETKRTVSEDDPSALSRAGRRLGWTVQPSSAMLTGAQSASGGCTIASKRGIGLAPHKDIVKQEYAHRFSLSWAAGIVRGGVHISSVVEKL